MLTTKHLAKEFGTLRAVDGVDFHLPQGELRAIIGPNGAGKSTFVNLLTGHLAVSEGQVFFRGEEITNFSPHRVTRKGIGRSFQVTNILPRLSVLENVRIAVQARYKFHNPFSHVSRLGKTWEGARVILDRVGLISESNVIAEDLSHGFQRNLEIGIALANGPELLILDEPTQGMGSEETASTVGLIQQLSQDGLTIAIIEHDMDVVMTLAETITVFHQGKILTEGTPEQISHNDVVQQVYLGVTG